MHTLGQIDRLNMEISDLEITDTAFQKYTWYGMSLLSHLPEYFEEADLEVRRKLIGSIFPVKLTFEAGKYRTAVLNPALAIILQKNKNLQNEKCGDILISENVSGDVPRTGLEPAHQLRYKNLNLVCLPISPPGHRCCASLLVYCWKFLSIKCRNSGFRSRRGRGQQLSWNRDEGPQPPCGCLSGDSATGPILFRLETR